ncbi:BppU family phage baseplate upper protein [Enterococcus faecium]|uniref:BppU family phage baseplate upper protein n=1 Tax=Enterococcus faecium TaxID=1352 RepID=UPI001C5B5666|nr:BppU family phage baseplate upper protein [Enterococcus faecium]MBW4154626.1 BppU family phage baseplate upper protein [Enterococcus faecium]
MAHIIKKGPIKVPTQPKDFGLQATGLVFKSYDNQIALEFNVTQQDGAPADLLGATLRLLMYVYDEADGTVTKEPVPFITKNLITESFLNGHVKYILPEALKAYSGVVETYVYIEYPDGSTSDNLGFTFRMKRSAIDGLAQDKADYFIEDFKQLLDGVKQEATDAVNEALAKVEVVSENVSSAQNDLTILEDRIDQTNQQIGDLGKLKKMYSNSADFGDYDYSGNKNLFSKPFVASNITGADNGSFVTQVGDSVRIEKSSAILDLGITYEIFIGNLLNNTQYTLSYDVLLEPGATGTLSDCNIALEGKYGDEYEYIGVFQLHNITTTDVYQKVTSTFISSANMEKCEKFKFRVYVANGVSLALKIKNVKIERGSTATPYQPNLLVEPYYLSKVALGENLIKPESQQPVTNSNYLINTYNIKPMVKGKKYTITLEGTKPATQVFRPFFTRATGDAWEVGDLQPVEGLTNVWSKTFTAADDSHPTTPQVQIYQVPSTSVGQCTIKWLKLEEGDTRTPNISQFKYFSEGLKDSNNPNDYSWDITPEYAEKSLNNTVSLTEPQSIEGLKNFEDGLQVKGVSVVQDNFTSKAVTTKNITDFTEDSIVRFERWGRLVIANIEITNKSANFAGWKNLMAFPLGYTPISLVGWGGTLSNKTNRNPALSVYANSSGISVMISSEDLPANQRCSGTVAYFTNDEWPQG